MKTTVESEQARKRDAEPGTVQSEASSGAVPAVDLHRLQRAIGNYGVQRVVERRLAGGMGARFGHALGNVRHVPARSGAAVVQRAGDEDTDNGTVTIQAPQSDSYGVSGTTLAEVHAQLDPTEWGHCTYHYDYTYDTTNGRATRVNITLRLVIRLPSWQEGRDEASPEARAEWDRMLAALRAHEARHAEIAREWAPTFKQRMLGELEADLPARHAEVLGEARQRQDAYDAQTNHGQSEGVSLDLTVDQEPPEEETEGEPAEDTEVETGE